MHPTNREFYERLGVLIRRRRRALDLTQETLAGRLNISRGTLANIETGRQNILLHHVFRLAAALEMNAHELLVAPPDAAEQASATTLPLPRGLTREQEAQVVHVLSHTSPRSRRRDKK